jgi:NitT/TauT family transport system substrate-binding protein
MKRSIAIVFVLGLIQAGGLTAASAQSLKKVKMTIPVVAHSMTPVYVAQSKGYFKDEGLDVDVTSTNGGGPDIRALIAGDVDFSFTTGDNVVLAQQEGKKLIMIASGLNKIFINWAMHKEAAKAKGITETSSLGDRMKALKGLTIGFTNPGALTAHLAGFITRKAGYSPQQDVNMIAIGSGPTWIAALENRKVDVALTAPPVPETAVSRGFAIPFLSYTQYAELGAPEFLMENLIVRPDTAAKDPELLRKMTRALVKANKWAISAPPEQVAEALKPFMAQIDPALLLSGVKAVVPTLSPDGRTSERSVQVTQDILEQAGILKKRLPYSELVSNEFLPK